MPAALAPSLLARTALEPSADRSVEQVFRAHAPLVWRTLHRMGVPEADLPDLLQEVFVVVQRKLASFDRSYQGRGARTTTWLFAIAARVASNYRRSARHRRECLVAEVPEVGGAESPETIVSQGQTRALVSAAIDALPPPHRAVFVMYELEGESGEEIAAQLGIPVGTVRSRLHHARKRVLAALPSHLRGKE
jgi:RNA polymerase sigma-70 factor (ECF subfamily)